MLHGEVEGCLAQVIIRTPFTLVSFRTRVSPNLRTRVSPNQEKYPTILRPRDRSRGRRSQLCEVTALRVTSASPASRQSAATSSRHKPPALGLRVEG